MPQLRILHGQGDGLRCNHSEHVFPQTCGTYYSYSVARNKYFDRRTLFLTGMIEERMFHQMTIDLNRYLLVLPYDRLPRIEHSRPLKEEKYTYPVKAMKINSMFSFGSRMNGPQGGLTFGSG